MNRRGATYTFSNVYLESSGSVVGPKEGKGPLGSLFDVVWEDERSSCNSFEKAELALLQQSYGVALHKAKREWHEIDFVVGGDLLDQIITTNFAARQHQRPLIGLFSACASFSEAMGIGAVLLSGHGTERVMVSASSHHSTAERQFRFPLELGYQRTPTAAWTATAAGCAILSRKPSPIKVEAATFGRVIDLGGQDANDMGSAMAPAAFDTIKQHMADMDREPASYDAIYTGDLGHFGLEMLRRYAEPTALHFGDELDDCGRSLYDASTQDTHNGGSGPGCSASVFAGPLVTRLMDRQWERLLLVATGALFSPTTFQQGETIPCIAHAVALSREEEAE